MTSSTSAYGGANNNYLYIGEKGSHREIAKRVLDRDLDYNEVVHHLDENPKNNKLRNLIILQRSYHSKLHKYIIKKTFTTDNYNDIKIEDSLKWLNDNSIEYIRLNEYNIHTYNN
jgi:hypothetical protein